MHPSLKVKTSIRYCNANPIEQSQTKDQTKSVIFQSSLPSRSSILFIPVHNHTEPQAKKPSLTPTTNKSAQSQSQNHKPVRRQYRDVQISERNYANAMRIQSVTVLSMTYQTTFRPHPKGGEACTAPTARGCNTVWYSKAK
jgi:hypothetical protein